MIKKFFAAVILVASLILTTPAQAADSRVEAAVQWAIEIANDPIHGYSQGAENATPSRPYTGSREGPDYDCASLVYHAFQHAGFDIIGAWHKNPQYMTRYNGKQYSGDADTIWADLQTLGGWKKIFVGGSCRQSSARRYSLPSAIPRCDL